MATGSANPANPDYSVPTQQPWAKVDTPAHATVSHSITELRSTL